MKKRIFLCIILAIIIAACVLPMSVSAADDGLPDIQNINYVGAFGTVSWSAVTYKATGTDGNLYDFDAIYDIKLYDENGNSAYEDNTLADNYINLFNLGIPSGSYYIEVTAFYVNATGYNFLSNITTSTVFYHKDNFTPTVSWSSSAVRSSIPDATVQFTLSTKSNDCTYYYAVVESGAAAPTIDTSGAGFPAFAGDNTVNITNLTSIGAYDLYLVVKEPDGDISETVMTTIPECTNYVMVNGVMLDASVPYYKNGAASATSNSDNYNVHYDAVNKNLYLWDAVITQGYTVSGVGTAGIYTPVEIKINLGGSNTISGVANGIVSDKPLTVLGDTLTITLSEGDGSGIRTTKSGDTLTIGGGTYNISGGKYGVRSNGDIVLTPKTMKISTLQDAIHAGENNDIIMSDGDLDLTITSTTGCGIYGNTITINCKTLKINSACYGIYCFDIIFDPQGSKFITMLAGSTAECADYNATYRTQTTFTRDNFKPYKYVMMEYRTSYFEDVNISLGEDITVNYFAGKSNLVSPEMRFTLNGYTQTVAGVLVGEQYKFSFDGVAPHWLCDTITAELLVGGAAVDTKQYSVLTYLNNIKSKTASDLGYSEEKHAAMVTLVDDLLVYGGASQSYKGYKTDALVSAGVTGTEFTTLGENDTHKAVTQGAVVTFKSATLFFDSTNELRFRFTAADTAGLTFKLSVNGGTAQDVAYVADGEGYLVKTDAIYATGFDDVYTLTAYVNDVEDATLTYSVKSYVHAKQSGENAMSALAKATYNYGKAAKAFINAQ